MWFWTRFWTAGHRLRDKCAQVDHPLRFLWLSQFHRALFHLKNRFGVEIKQASERNVHGFKGYRLKQAQTAML